MVHNVSGLLISLKQMHEMASHLYQVCHALAEALKFQARWVPVDYSQNSDSKKTRIDWYYMNTPLTEEKVDAKKSNRTKLARTAKEWLKARGVSGTEKLKFVTTEDPFY